MNAKGSFAVAKWEENPYDQISSDMKMTKASVEYSMSGEIIGKGLVEYLMFYKYFDPNDQHKSSAVYTGLMRFVGSVHGKEGSFVMRDEGSFENGTAKSSLRIIEGSGLGNLKGIMGTGQYHAGKDAIQFELEYTL
jgi:hypothetical protein